MRRALGRVVPMGPKVRLILRGIARHDVALHARDLELMHLEYLWNDAPREARLYLLDHLLIGNGVVAAPFMCVIVHRDGLAVDLAHEARLHAAMGFVELDELLAELGLEHIGQHNDRRLQFKSGEAAWRRKALEIGKDRGNVALVACEWEGPEHAQRGVHHDPLSPRGNVARARRCVARYCAIKLADGAVEIPEKTVARVGIRHALVGLVTGIETDAEEARVCVVENLSPGTDSLDRRPAMGVGRGAEEAKYDVASRRVIECVARICVRALMKPRRWIAGGQIDVGCHADHTRRAQVKLSVAGRNLYHVGSPMYSSRLRDPDWFGFPCWRHCGMAGQGLLRQKCETG